jgi:energy-coupling factor transport system permease protein
MRGGANRVRSPLAYVPRDTPLADAGALAASVYLGSFVVVAFAFSSPILLAGAGAGALVAGVGAEAGRAIRAAARWGLVLGVFVAAINGFVSQRGDTVIVHGLWLPLLGATDVSGEALAEGAVLALRILVVMIAFAVHCASVDPDRMLRLLRPVARHSALTATLIARLVPLAAADYRRLADAATLRGPGAAPVGRAALARRLVAGSLDRAVDVAATLELRGYANGAPGSGRGVHRSRHDRRFLAAGVAIVAAGVAGRIAGLGSFDAYPVVDVGADPATLLLAVSIPVAAALPFAAAGRRRRR